MKNTTPKIPIRLPTNSIVDANSGSSGGQKIAIRAPTAIIGMPTPTVIAFDATLNFISEIYNNFIPGLGHPEIGSLYEEQAEDLDLIMTKLDPEKAKYTTVQAALGRKA